MGNRIPTEAWRIVEPKVRRYPQNKAEYEERIDEIMNQKGGSDGQPKGNSIGNPTERLAIKIADDPWLQRVKQEIDAVESVYNNMRPEHQKVIRVRFWSYRYHNMKYFDMERCISYRERQMQRIVRDFIYAVGKKLGEI